MERGSELKGPIIRKNARIAADSTIMPGVTIGKGAIVGAGSVVTRDVPQYTVVMGMPARAVKNAPREEAGR
jgi:UDP-2-acetamido-3-amino-2,3-dideoxy-glucuronate N-acetyltransferase